MTREVLDTMSYAERKAVPINLNTVVNEMNIWLCVRNLVTIICGDCGVQTYRGEETVQVYITDREGHFRVTLGGTWREIRDNIHCC